MCLGCAFLHALNTMDVNDLGYDGVMGFNEEAALRHVYHQS